MAAENQDWFAELNLQPVESNYEVQGGAHRDAPGGTLERSGLFRLNLEGSASVDRVALQTGFKQQYSIKYYADPVHKVVVGYVVDGTEKGSIAVRRSTDGKFVSLHLGGVFQEHPALRPGGRRQCPIQDRLDGNGRPCLVIQLAAAVTKVKGRREDTAAPPERPAVKPVATTAVGESTGAVTAKVAGETAGEVAGKVAGETAGEVAGKVAEQVARQIESAAASKPAEAGTGA